MASSASTGDRRRRVAGRNRTCDARSVRNSLVLIMTFALTDLVRAQVPAAVGPPEIMHWCAQHCTTLTLDHGKPFDQVHYGSEAAGSLWIVERFTRDSVVIQRTDFRPLPGKATLTGRLSATGDSIVNGEMRWTYHPCCGLTAGKYEAAWGEAIHSVPGSDQERAALAARLGRGQAAPLPQPADCRDGGQAPASSERALEIGKQNALARRNNIAMACFLMAANQGNASAQMNVGYAYERGITVPSDSAEALRWYIKAAEQDNTAAQETVARFYSKGIGVEPDASEAAKWTARLNTIRQDRIQVCRLPEVKDSMSRVELQSVSDGAGQLLTALAGAFTGVQANFKDARPELIYTQGTDQQQQYGPFHIDMGMQTGDFDCKATFLRGHRKDCRGDDPCHPGRTPGYSVCTEDNAGLDTQLTEAGAVALLNLYPTFYEVFRIRPLEGKRYQVTLVPTSLQLARTYSDTTVTERKPVERPVCLAPEK